MTRRKGLTPLVALLALAAAISTAKGQSAPPPGERGERRTLTGKERLTGKAADEQRLDDCKVPPERRGSSRRPADCSER